MDPKVKPHDLRDDCYPPFPPGYGKTPAASEGVMPESGGDGFVLVTPDAGNVPEGQITKE
jgi:hypothetical protein